MTLDIIQNVGAVCGVIVTVIGLVVMIIKPVRDKFAEWITKTSDKENLSKKIDDLTTLVLAQIEQNQQQKAELDKQSEALTSTIRNTILMIYWKYKDSSTLPALERENIAHLQSSYAALGGNSFVESCCKELMSKPIT